MAHTMDDVVHVVVNVSPTATALAGFNLALIMGQSVNTAVDAGRRVKEYQGVSEMLEDGYDGVSAVYRAASLYFAQSPKPSRVLVGLQYIDSNEPGNSESYVEAVNAVRALRDDWYALIPSGAAESDILALAQYVEGLNKVMFVTLTAYSVITEPTANIAKTLKDAGYRRTLAQYSVQTPEAAASIAGYVAGAVSRTANSAFTLNAKKEPGVLPEPLTSAQLTLLKIQNVNYCLERGMTYQNFEPGKVCVGAFFDEVLYLDMLASDIQTACADLISNSRKVPQTEEGMAQFYAAISTACETYVAMGFLAPGVWNGPDILALAAGDTLSTGYFIQSEKIDDQSVSDRENRISPPIYVAIKLAGAVHSAIIQVDVNR
jgi:hypothetical protein